MAYEWRRILVLILALSLAQLTWARVLAQPYKRLSSTFIFEEPDSEKCNQSGTYYNGTCTCNEGHYGQYCECEGFNINNQDYDASCKRTNGSAVCGGYGECVCGSCDCYPVMSGDPSRRYSGQYCECDDYSCDYYDNKICGGSEHGRCNCGVCMCHPGFEGSACECALSQETCLAKEPDAHGRRLICNGKGTCICGRCLCNLDSYYRGDTCEECPTCEAYSGNDL